MRLCLWSVKKIFFECQTPFNSAPKKMPNHGNNDSGSILPDHKAMRASYLYVCWVTSSPVRSTNSTTSQQAFRQAQIFLPPNVGFQMQPVVFKPYCQKLTIMMWKGGQTCAKRRLCFSERLTPVELRTYATLMDTIKKPWQAHTDVNILKIPSDAV